MALQGTLDTFALVDVLRLLSTTRKVGRLRVSGEAGSGSLWLDTGDIVGSELLVRGAQAGSAVEVVFQLLRFEQGSFVFDAGSVPSSTGDARDVESVLVEAEVMLAERRSLEEVVPSLDAWLSLALTPALGEREVLIDAGRWCIIAATGSGASVAEVGRTAGLGDLAVMRAVKDLVELGLLEIGEAARPSTARPPRAVPDEPAWSAPPLATAPLAAAPLATAPPADAPLATEPLAAPAPDVDAASPAATTAPVGALPDAPADPPADPPRLGLDGLSLAYPGGLSALPEDAPLDPSSVDALGVMDLPGFARDLPLAPPSSAEVRFGLGSLPTSEEVLRQYPPEPILEDASEIARQLANLSPRAARAVAAAAKATTEEERDAALAAIEAEDDTINRGLLLKFLGAVDG